MFLFYLPQVVLRIIFDLLDFKSKMDMWEALKVIHCSLEGQLTPESVRDVLRHSIANKRICFAGKPELLRRPAVLDLAAWITDLDLRGVLNIHVQILKPVLKRCQNLRRLDISKTSINIFQASKICNVCPKLTSLACNLTNVGELYRYSNTRDKSYREVLVQRSLKNLRHIAFDIDDIRVLKNGTVNKILKLCDDLLTLHINVITRSIYFETNIKLSWTPPKLKIVTIFIEYSGEFSQISEKFSYSPDWQILAIHGHYYKRNYYMTRKLMNRDLTKTNRCHPMGKTYEVFNNNYNYLYMLHKNLEIHNPDLYEIVIRELKNKEGTAKCASEHYFGSNKVNICPCCLPTFKAEEHPNLKLEPLHGNNCHYQPKVFTTQLQTGENFKKVCVLPTVCSHQNILILCNIPDPAQFNSITYLCIMEVRLDASFSHLFKRLRHLETLKLVTSEYRGNYYAILKNLHESSRLRELVYIAEMDCDEDILTLCPSCPTLERLEYKMTLAPQESVYERLLAGCPYLKKIVLHTDYSHPRSRADPRYLVSRLRKFYLTNNPGLCFTVECKNSALYHQLIYEDTHEDDPLDIKKYIKLR